MKSKHSKFASEAITDALFGNKLSILIFSLSCASNENIICKNNMFQKKFLDFLCSLFNKEKT